jgi:DNA-binding transcriptional LysR family regulator
VGREAAAERWGLDTLEAIARTDSSRAASAVLGLHHSSVQSRQNRLEHLLGFKLGTADGRTRAMAALTLYRLLGTHG